MTTSEYRIVQLCTEPMWAVMDEHNVLQCRCYDLAQATMIVGLLQETDE